MYTIIRLTCETNIRVVVLNCLTYNNNFYNFNSFYNSNSRFCGISFEFRTVLIYIEWQFMMKIITLL